MPEHRRLQARDRRRLHRQRHLEGIGDGQRRQHQRRRVGRAQRQRVAFEQRDHLPGHGGQQCRFRVDSLGIQARGAQLGQPRVDARARDHHHRNAAGGRITIADGEVQVFDFVGNAFFERVGNDLRELGRALGGRIAFGGQRFAGRKDDCDPASGSHGAWPARALRRPRSTTTWPSPLHTIHWGAAPSRS